MDTNLRVADTQAVVGNTQTAVTDTRTMVADTQVTVSNTQTMVADIHRNMLTGQNGASGKIDSVGATCCI